MGCCSATKGRRGGGYREIAGERWKDAREAMVAARFVKVTPFGGHGMK